MESVNIVYLTKNGGTGFKRSLRQVLQQKYNGDKSVYVIDSGSTDNTIEFAESHGCTVYKIKSEQFGFSKTKNFALKKVSESDYIVFVSQDIIPYDNQWLSEMVNGVKGFVAGYCKQIIGKESPNIQNLYSNLDRIQTQPIIQIEDGFISNACAIYDFNFLQRNQFPEWVYTNEDQVWAWKVINSGHQIKYLSKTKVYNIHSEGIITLFKKYFDHGNVMGILYQYLPTYRIKRKFIIKKVISDLLNPNIFPVTEFSKLLGFYIGSKYRILPYKLCQQFSYIKKLRSKMNLELQYSKLRKIGLSVSQSE